MFTLPSIWNIVISTIVFVFAAWYLRRLLDKHGVRKGFTRGLLIFVLAYLISYASGLLVDWSREKMYGPEPVSEAQKKLDETLEILKENGISPP